MDTSADGYSPPAALVGTPETRLVRQPDGTFALQVWRPAYPDATVSSILGQRVPHDPVTGALGVWVTIDDDAPIVSLDELSDPEISSPQRLDASTSALAMETRDAVAAARRDVLACTDEVMLNRYLRAPSREAAAKIGPDNAVPPASHPPACAPPTLPPPSRKLSTSRPAIEKRVADGLEVSTSRALVTLREAASYMSCSRRHIERLLARGELPRVELGRAVRVAVSDLDQYIEVHRSEG